MDPLNMRTEQLEEEARRQRALATVITEAGTLLDLSDRAPQIAADLDAVAQRIVEAAIDSAHDPADLRRQVAALVAAM